MKRLLTFTLLLTLAAPLCASDWPSFRGPRASGNGDGAGLPTAFDAEQGENLLWKTKIPGLGHASPVIWGDRIFVTTAGRKEGGRDELKAGLYGNVDAVEGEGVIVWSAHALDRKTGKIVWSQTLAEGEARVKRHTKATHANASPATDGKHVVAVLGSQGLFCLDAKAGKLKWKKNLGLLDAGWFFNKGYQWGHASSPIIHDGKVIVQIDVHSGAYLAAFDVKSGKELWRTARDELSAWGTPTIVEGAGGIEIFTNGSRALVGYDVDSGKELWRIKNDSEVTVATPVVGGGLVYFSNGYPPTRSIHAVKPGARGDQSLVEDADSNEAVVWYVPTGGTYMPTPVYYRGRLYTLANNGTLTCYDAKSGERLWRERVAGKGGAYSASPVVADGHLYLASEDGEVHVVKVTDGYEYVGENPVGEVLMASPAIADGMLVVRGRDHVFAFGEKKKAKVD